MILAAKVALVCAGTVVAGTGLLCSEGFLRVDVTERGPEPHHINVIAPAMLVPIAVRFATHFTPREKFAAAADQIEPWMPGIQAGLNELSKVDSMTLVEVNEPGEHVHVAKLGSSIVVDVEEKNEVVHISVPIRSISNTLQEIADSAPGSNP